MAISLVVASFRTLRALKMATNRIKVATGDSSAGNSLSSNVVSVLAANFFSWLKMMPVTTRRSSNPATINRPAIAKCAQLFPLLFTSKSFRVSSTKCSRKSGAGGTLFVATAAAAAVVLLLA